MGRLVFSLCRCIFLAGRWRICRYVVCHDVFIVVFLFAVAGTTDDVTPAISISRNYFQIDPRGWYFNLSATLSGTFHSSSFASHDARLLDSAQG